MISARFVAQVAIVAAFIAGAARVSAAQAINTQLWGTDGSVLASARLGRTLFIGGDFTRVAPCTGGGVAVDASSAALAAKFPRVAGAVSAVVSDGLGGWFIGGSFVGVDGVPCRNLAHLLAGGTVASWRPDPDDAVTALAIDNGRLYVGGSFTSIAGEHRGHIAEISAATGHLTDWAPEISGSIILTTEILVILRSGSRVYVGGNFTSVAGQPRSCVAAIDARSGVASDWRPDADFRVRAIAIGDSNVYLGGEFSTVGGQVRSDIAAVGLTSGVATPWNPHVASGVEEEPYDPSVTGLIVAGAHLLACGHFTNVGPDLRGGIAQIDLGTGRATSWNPNPVSIEGLYTAPFVDAMVERDGTLYFGGLFVSIAGVGRSGAAAVDIASGRTTSWNPFPSGRVLAVASQSDRIFIGGDFTIMGGESRHCLAAIDLDTGKAKDWNPNPDGILINSLLAIGGGVYVGGPFSNISGVERQGVAELDAATGRAGPWNAHSDGAVTSMVLNRGRLFVVGGFGNIGGQPRVRCAALDTSTAAATAWNPGANDIVYAVTVFGNTVYLGGWFSNVGGQPRNYLAAVDDSVGAPTTWSSDTDGPVNVLASGDSSVFVGGDFNYVDGQPRDGIAAIDPGTGLPKPWLANASRQVLTLCVGGSVVYAGGGFSSIGGKSRPGLAAIDATSGAVLDWNPSTSGVVWSLSADHQSVYVGGGYDQMGANPSANLSVIALAGGRFAGSPALGPRAMVSLGPSRPNPVAADGLLEIALSQGGLVTLAVYDLAGRKVATLLDRAPKPAGQFELPLQTEGWKNGVYFCRLECSGQTATRRFTVLK